MSIKDGAFINIIESIKNMMENSPKAEFIENDEYFLFCVGENTTEGHANGIFCFDDQNAEKIFKEAEDYFKNKGFSYTFWIRDKKNEKIEKILLDKGYEPNREPGLPVMAIDRKLNIPNLDSDYKLVQVKTIQEIRDFITVVRNCFSLEENTAQAMFNSSDVLDGKVNKGYLVYYKNRPVSAVQTYKAGGVAGIYWVATEEDMRGRGLGKFITSIGTNEALDLGVDTVVLQASRLGEPVYEKLGYKLIEYYRTYKIKIDEE
ncbi:MAG: GNAT family N-acetyltransferase [Andreesenia angusta]|nr:GNAT family N-acetyltransferase [Andreesenia angusta]